VYPVSARNDDNPAKLAAVEDIPSFVDSSNKGRHTGGTGIDLTTPRQFHRDREVSGRQLKHLTKWHVENRKGKSGRSSLGSAQSASS
jgi:hypothetical protein